MVETCVNNKLAEVGWFSESDRGRFGEEALGRWIRGEEEEWRPRISCFWMRETGYPQEVEALMRLDV